MKPTTPSSQTPEAKPDLPPESRAFYDLLRRWRVWYRWRKALESSIKGMLFGIAFAFGFTSVMVLGGQGVRLGYGLMEMGLTYAAAGMGLGLLAGMIAGVWSVPLLRVARFMEQTYHLQERASTALEQLQKYPEQVPSEIALIQLRDALEWGARVKPEASFFWRVSRAQWVIAGSVLLLTILLAIAGRPIFQQIEQRKFVKKAISAEISQLQSLQSALQEDSSISAEEQQELNQKIQEAIKNLEKAESIEEAVAVISSLEDDLEKRLDPDIEAKINALQQLGNQIHQSAQEQGGNNPLKPLGQALEKGDFSDAAQRLSNLDLENLSPQERQALQEQFKKAAEALSETHPELAESFNQTAQALEADDLQAAQQALQEAAQALTQTSQAISQTNTIRQAATQTGESAARLLEAARAAQGMSAQTAGTSGDGASGQGQDTEQPGAAENSPGAAGNSSDPAGGSGSGSGKGSADQGALQGSEAGSDPISQGNPPGDAGERPFVPLTETQRLKGSEGAEIYLPTSPDPQAETIGQASPTTGESGASTVPYTQVFPQYSDSYRRALESGNIPASLRNLVRKYFSNLEP